MTTIKFKKRLLKKNIHPIHWWTLLKIHTLFFGIGLLLYYLLSFIPLEFYNFNELAVEDVDASDFYYQTQDSGEKSLDNIIIINSGSIPVEEGVGLRRNLNQLIRNIDNNDCKPKKIGIDLEFDMRRVDSVDAKLEKTFIEKHCVIAESKQNVSIFKTVKKGYVNFPDEENKAVRNYYNYYVLNNKKINSFARECLGQTVEEPEEFLLKYACKDQGFYNVLDKQNEEETVFAFPAVEGSVVLSDSLNKKQLHDLFHDKTVLIGHLGQDSMHNVNDIIDKHKTPTDFDVIRKSKIMPGVVIHANAINQLQMHHAIFDFTYLFNFILLYGILLFFFIVFILLERLKSIFLRVFIELALIIITVPLMHYWSVKLFASDIHINTVELIIIITFLIELKSVYLFYYEKNLKHDHHNKEQEAHPNTNHKTASL